jgi:superfamily I DNA/RNA helicase
MSGTTWWVGKKDLDDDQRNIIRLPLDECALVTGPPGCGKTNLLLLRANYLHLAKKRNIAVVVFTRSLREFIARGAAQYDFPASKIMTCRQWQLDLLRQYGDTVPKTSGKFEQDRTAFIAATTNLADKLKLANIFDAILLDEAQDYTPAEIQLFGRLTERLFCVADERQKIYEGEDSIEAIRSCVGEPHVLRFHYRNGVKICRVADEIAKKWHGYRPLTETSNYPEKANPSTVDCEQRKTVVEQASLIVTRLGTQLIAFPNELIGVLAPTKESMNAIWQVVSASKHSGRAFLLHGSASDSFPSDKQIVISTFHAAKGLEFRALHMAACDELKSSFFRNNRRMTFTAVTRAKTALSIYHSNDLYGYLEAALQSLIPSPQPPSLDEVFGGSK